MPQTHIRFDWAIKKLLRNKANYVVLAGFLSELLGKQIKIQSILESESNQQAEDDKLNRVDILAENDQGELILVEVQNNTEQDYFHRMLYGTARLITDFLEKGEPYGKVKKVYSVNIESSRSEGRLDGLEEGLKEGIKQGMEKGKQQEKINIARTLKQKGIDIEAIAGATGLSRKEIEEL